MTEEKKNVRANIPPLVRAKLWVAAAGRCQFRSCNKPLDRNVLTQQKIFVGQHAHIIGDSVNGPRGNLELSKELAQDVGNLMLTCRDCHVTIDGLADEYSVDDLQAMKRLHEERVQALYDIGDTKESVAIVLRHPIRGQIPQFTLTDVRAAILGNSAFSNMPSLGAVDIDYRNRSAREDDSGYWAELVRQLEQDYRSQLHHVSHRKAPEHFSVFAFAPIPLLIQLGAFIGNKTPAAVYQWFRTNESWKFPVERATQRQIFSRDEVPPTADEEIAVLMALSGEIDRLAVEEALPGRLVVRIGVPVPSPSLIEDAEDIRNFRSSMVELLAAIRNSGYRRIHVFPAIPLSIAVEFGRLILPKADPPIDIWDYIQGKFARTIHLKV